MRHFLTSIRRLRPTHFLAGLFIALTATFASSADVPQAIPLQGELRDAGGVAVPGPVMLVVGIWRDPTSVKPSALAYQEEHLGVPVHDGLFEIELGTGDVIAGSFGSGLFGEELWIEVVVDREVLVPRVPLATVPYAFKAEDADTLGGRPVTSLQMRINGTCSVGSFIVAITADGGVECASSSGGGALRVSAPIEGDGSAGAPLGLQAAGVSAGHLANASVNSSAIEDFSIAAVDIGVGVVSSPHIATVFLQRAHERSGSLEAIS